MRPRSLAEVAAAVRGTVRPKEAADLRVRGAAVDSREIRPGDLFVALAGERADGHAFLSDAFARGASAALVARRGGGAAAAGAPREELPAVVEVDDPRAALLDLGRAERAGLPALVVGITGSTGKTCTKDLTAAVLEQRFRVVASPASFNNEVGLPLTLLAAEEDTEVVVCEMGSRGPGHIRLLCEVARPEIGVVTNVGVAHMELFGSPEALRDAKAELPEALPPGGTAVLNADDAVVRSYAARTPAKVLTFGSGETADVRAEDIRIGLGTGLAAFDLVVAARRTRVALPVPGEHIVPDALAAAAVGVALGLTPEEVAHGIAGASMSGGRMEVLEGVRGLRVVNDAYNANPTSMAAALRAARWMAGDRRCVAVLGLMAELGPIADEEHQRIGELVARLGIDGLVVMGVEARLIAAGASRGGVEADRIAVCADPAEAARAVWRYTEPGDVVLVKGSRVARLERVVNVLLAPAGELEEAGA